MKAMKHSYSAPHLEYILIIVLLLTYYTVTS